MISVVTPSFNQGKYIERTLQSVLSQNIPSLEYVVVDGGSSDETLSILKQYEGSLRFISEQDQGQADAVNKGLQMTNGEIIGWLNSDDIYYPDTLRRVIDFFNDHPHVDVVYGKANHIDQDDQFIEAYPTYPWDVKRLKSSCFLSQPSVFFRRRVINRFGLLNPNLHYCLDYEYWLRLALGGATFAFIPQVLAGSRLYPETKTLKHASSAQQELLTMLKNRFGFIPTEWIIEYAVRSIKSKTQFRMPQLKFVISTLAVACVAGFRWNGMWKGMSTSISLPKKMFIMHQERKK